MICKSINILLFSDSFNKNKSQVDSKDRLETDDHVNSLIDLLDAVNNVDESLQASINISRAQSITELSSLVRKKDVDVVILDLIPPILEKLEFFIPICSQISSIAIIVISNVDDEIIALKALELGIQEYLDINNLTPQFLKKVLFRATHRQKAIELAIKNSIENQGQSLELFTQIHPLDNKSEIINSPTKEFLLRKQSQALIQLISSKNLLQAANFNIAFREITEISAKALGLSRVSIWLHNKGNSVLECIDMYDHSQQNHYSNIQLHRKDYPIYFHALQIEHIVSIPNIQNDVRSKELVDLYYQDSKVISLLSVAIRSWEHLIGIVFCEHTGTPREWTLEEEYFVSSIASFASLAIEAKDSGNAREILQQSEAQFRAIFERSSIGIGLIDMSHRIVDVNPTLCNMLGYSHTQMYGNKFAEYLHPQEVKSDLELYEQLIAGICDRFEMEKLFLHQDGSIVWTYLSISLIKASNGKPKFFLAIVDDITERKQTELKLRKSKNEAEAGSRAKSEFLATMSHELRTPLNAIMGLSQLLYQEIVGELNDKQREYINCIYDSGEHLLALINDILDLSKVEAGKEELMLCVLSVQDLCNAVISTVRDRAQEKELELTCFIDERAEVCIADERRAKQMLLNLLTNAIKFTNVGSVSLKVRKILSGILFTVTDTGIGIDPDKFSSLFQPFQQLDSRLNRQYEGTGLGLALTQKLARLHGGEITLESTLGKGSSFTLFLPNQPYQEQLQPETLILQQDDSSIFNNSKLDNTQSSNPKIIKPKRILLVEDDENTTILLQDYLQTVGYHVEVLKKIENFITQIQNKNPDLILLEVNLINDVYGWNLLKEIRKQSDLRDLPIIMIVPMGMKHEYPGNLSDDQDLDTNSTIVNGYLNKPIRTVELESILLSCL
ncbi:MAG: PAS domain S-box protein [Cyanobacteria bacterium P01_A01_bin.45]